MFLFMSLLCSVLTFGWGRRPAFAATLVFFVTDFVASRTVGMVAAVRTVGHLGKKEREESLLLKKNGCIITQSLTCRTHFYATK